MKIYDGGNGPDKSFTQGTQQTCKRSWEKTQVQVPTATKWDLLLKISDSEILEIKSFSFNAVDYLPVIKKFEVNCTLHRNTIYKQYAKTLLKPF